MWLAIIYQFLGEHSYVVYVDGSEEFQWREFATVRDEGEGM
jgi:hypothetical protein